MAARRVFLADGTEALKPEDIPHEADVYVSTGEPFLDPFKKIKGKKRDLGQRKQHIAMKQKVLTMKTDTH